ncbi:PRC-barrel domain-containing protein [Falsirhodobacter sp. alg1]|uniref:PRC-barrel domain-containing protein n=1 Tax=Falsirhodobacter sp. alg1 TaxID=1472418 RepID=UPI000693FF53|nr:PRC-barrel domain-containing protein [Falsirhodobacter sp. alg1]
MKKLAISTAALALMSGVAFAQTSTAPTTGTGETTTGTGASQAPLTGNTASPEAPPKDTGDEGGAPALESEGMDNDHSTTMPEGSQQSMPETDMGDTDAAPMTDDHSTMGDAHMMEPPEGFMATEATMLEPDMLDGIDVYGNDDESIGSVSEVIPAEGTPQQVIVDVGGFLGIGAKSVALNVSELNFFKETDGDTVRAYTTMTEDEMEALPEYEG